MSTNHYDWEEPESDTSRMDSTGFEVAQALPVHRRTVTPAYDPEVDGPVQLEMDESTGWPPDRDIVAPGSKSVRQTIDPFADPFADPNTAAASAAAVKAAHEAVRRNASVNDPFDEAEDSSSSPIPVNPDPVESSKPVKKSKEDTDDEKSKSKGSTRFGRKDRELEKKTFEEAFAVDESGKTVNSMMPRMPKLAPMKMPDFSALKRIDMESVREYAPAILACIGLGLVVIFIGPWCKGLAIIAGIATALGVLFSYSQGTREFATIIASLSLMTVLARHAPWLVVPFTLIVVWMFRPVADQQSHGMPSKRGSEY